MTEEEIVEVRELIDNHDKLEEISGFLLNKLCVFNVFVAMLFFIVFWEDRERQIVGGVGMAFIVTTYTIYNAYKFHKLMDGK